MSEVECRHDASTTCPRCDPHMIRHRLGRAPHSVPTPAAELEARILRRVAQALRDAYEPGCYGNGGPQDGDDIPPEFHARQAADALDKAADEVLKP